MRIKNASWAHYYVTASAFLLQYFAFLIEHRRLIEFKID